MKKTADGQGWRVGTREGFDRNGNVCCERCFQKDREIERLREENKILKGRLRIRERAEAAIVSGVHASPSSRPLKKKSRLEVRDRKGGAVLGHRGVGRKQLTESTASRVVVVEAPTHCPQCESELYAHDRRERSLLEVAEVKVQQTLYQQKRNRCPCCKKVFVGEIAALPKTLYGNSLLAQVATMHYVHGITLGRICEMLGPEVKISGIIAALHRVARLFEPSLDKLIQNYRKSAVKHADETSWRTDGAPGWSWLFSSSTTSIFQFRDTRASRVAHEVLGQDPLPGVLIVDRYNGYRKVLCKTQYCYAHLLREVLRLEQDFPDSDEVASFVSQFAPTLSLAMRLRAQPITDEQYYIEAEELEEKIKLISQRPYQHEGIRHIQRIFVSSERNLFHWVRDRNVPAENNKAERELRQTVISRKTSFGSQSETGAKTRSILMSVLHTAKKRLNGKPVEQWLKDALDEFALKRISAIEHAIPPDLTTH